MAETKRRFYNFGDAKGFTKNDFFNGVIALANGEDLTDETIDLFRAAAEYEIEGAALAKGNKTPGEKKDPLESDYAVALRAAIVPLVSSTPMSAKELIDIATGKGLLSPKGIPFAAPWVSRVLNKADGVVAVSKVVEKTDAKGLRSQAEVTAYIAG